MSAEAMHASAPPGHGCADCAMDSEPCPTCYHAWWQKRHPNTVQIGGFGDANAASQLAAPQVADAGEQCPVARSTQFHCADPQRQREIADKEVADAAQPVAWVMVPREPTPEMLRAMQHQIDFDRTDQNTCELEHESQTACVDDKGELIGHVGTTLKQDLTDAYRAMLAASPPAQQDAPLSEDAKDAERYRWLRQQHWDTAALACVVNPKHAVKLGHDCPSLERLDEAIDAALRDSMAQMEKESGNG